jgi:DNA helicase-2/ATP-dependent DNA helicase PcrA
MITLNEEQQKAAEALNGAVMVLAGAGSGKTRVLTKRIENLIESGVSPYNILAITFTNKAANEMKERLFHNYDTHGITVCTIHSMCALILRAEADKLGYKQGFTIYTDTDTSRVLKRLVKETNNDTVLDRAEHYISMAKNSGATISQFIDEANISGEAEGEDLARVLIGYEKSLKESNAMDFDDLLLNTYILFRDFPSVLNKYRERFRYISIDEFQDTNAVQYKIFTLLSGKEGNIFVVGDDDQSIYGWRGADADNMMRFKQDFPDCQIFYLQQNYRSTKKILDVANAVISKNENRFEKKLWTTNPDGVRVENYSASNEMEEVRFVLDNIQGLIRRGSYKYSDFAILMRINALSRGFEQEFLSYGVPYKVFGGFKFFERKEIKDATAYLRLIINPYDDEAFLRTVNMPKRGIGDVTLAKLKNFARSKSTCMLYALTDIEEEGLFNASTTNKLTDFYALVTHLFEASKQMALPQLVLTTLTDTRLLSNAQNGDDDSAAQNLNEFIHSAAEYYSANPNGSLLDYLESISLKSDLDEMDGNNYVTIATIHSAKGLEWKSVFVVGLDEGIFPSNRAILNLAQMQEERRLMYVAATRAKERLFITRAASRFMYNERKYMTASRFFKEIVGEPPVNMRYDADGVPLHTNSVLSPSENSVTALKQNPEEVTSAFKTGQKVLHKVYGEGIILSIQDGKADVSFKTAGKKTLALKYAPLSII